jgi:hypothetical protein
MTRTLRALPLAALTLLACTIPAAAQDTKTTRGTVTAMTGTQVTVQVAGAAMNFAYDDKTVVEARGAGTPRSRRQRPRRPVPPCPTC